MRSVRLLAAVLLALCAVPIAARSASAGEPDSRRGPARYLGHLDKLTATEAAHLATLLKEIPNSCRGFREGVGQKCETIDAALGELFGGLYDPRFADLVVYVPKEGSVLDPYLLWKGTNTPFLYGNQQVFVVLVSERSNAVLDVHLTTLTARLSNPFQALLGALKLPAGDASKEEKVAAHPVVRLSLSPLTAEEQPSLWFSQTSLTVQADTVNRITIVPRSARITVKATLDGAPDKPDGPKTTVTVEEPAGTVTDFRPGALTRPAGEDGAPGALRSVNASFSVSDGSRLAFGFCTAATYSTDRFNSKDGAVLASETSYAAFVIGKAYLVRPRLAVRAEDSWTRSRYRPSLGLVTGTNITGDLFNQVVVALSLGHLIERCGLLAGVNLIAAPKDQPGKRQARLFVGLEYTF